MHKKAVVSLPFFLLAIAAMGAAQSPEAPKNMAAPKSTEPLKFYKLEFVVKEVEAGKVLNARAYSMMVTANGPGNNSSIRTGTRVPVQSGQVVPGQQIQFSYVDVGVNIDCRGINELDRGLALTISAEISSVPSETAAPATGAMTAPPAVRQNKWTSLVIVPINKSTLIFASDDLSSTRQMQLELTVRPIT